MSNDFFFMHCISTYQKCSEDSSNQESMQVPVTECINFDDAVQKAANAFGCSKDSAASCDSLVWDENNKPILIEFKNGKISNKVKRNIRGKMCNSVLFLEYFLGKKWIELRSELEFILVYNKEQNPQSSKQYLRDYSSNLAAGTKDIRFGLEKAYNLYFHEIKTLNEDEFSDLVKKRKYHT